MVSARPPSPPTTRWRNTALALCAAIVLSSALPSGTAVATTGAERQLHRLINRARASAGLGALDLSARLSRRAHQHSQQMARSNTLFHSGSVPGGENVGYAGSLQEVHNLLMNSSSHRANILSRGFDRVGVGVVQGNGYIWVTQIFAR